MSMLIDQVFKSDPLVKLAQKKNFVGWVYGIDYEQALVMTNDLWKAGVNGIPHNCFLVATTFDPERYSETKEIDREVILFRVIGAARLPQDDDLVRTKIDHFQDQEGAFENGTGFDDITLNQIQFGGLKCRILGTFYTFENKLWLGSDLESFSLASRLRVYRPNDEALELIINHVDPIRSKAMLKDAEELGLSKPIDRIRVGTVRYTSTDRLHRKNAPSEVPVYLQPSDFLARRTAVLGMTRTGKSNMLKKMVSMVKRVADEAHMPIGQIIFDLNGEYANANKQDQGAISEVYPDATVRYRGFDTEGFQDLRNNFYVNLSEGLYLLQSLLQQDAFKQADLEIFKSMSLEEPERSARSEHNRWQVRKSAYLCLLRRAGFTPPSGRTLKFPAAKVVLEQIEQQTGVSLPNPAEGMSLDEGIEWFLTARRADSQLRRNKNFLANSSKNEWLDEETRALLNLMAERNDRDTPIRGFKALIPFRPYHSPRRSAELVGEVYGHLEDGKIVILDLSVGPATIREEMSIRIAEGIFQRSMETFVSGEFPPHIVAYIEEAHNLIGKKHELTDTWPRIAKEGAKYRMALVYATQEPSSVHPNILANTENWFVTHLNNEGELREISKFYDFSDFGKSLIRAQDVGFARVKTLSGPFVVPVQIDLFDPKAEIERQSAEPTNNVARV
jgi:hypothetical protein